MLQPQWWDLVSSVTLASVRVQAEQNSSRSFTLGGWLAQLGHTAPMRCDCTCWGAPGVQGSCQRRRQKAGWGGTETRLTLGQRAEHTGLAVESRPQRRSQGKVGSRPLPGEEGTASLNMSSRGFCPLLTRAYWSLDFLWVCLSSLF